MKHPGVNLSEVPRIALRVKEAAAAIGVSSWTMTKLIKEKRIPKTAQNLVSIEALLIFMREETEKVKQGWEK